MKKGDEVWTRNGNDEVARLRVTGTTTHGVTGVWMDGALKGKEANVEKQTLSEMAANMHGKRAVTICAEPLLEPQGEAIAAPEAAPAERVHKSTDAARAAARERVRRWRAAKMNKEKIDV